MKPKQLLLEIIDTTLDALEQQIVLYGQQGNEEQELYNKIEEHIKEIYHLTYLEFKKHGWE